MGNVQIKTPMVKPFRVTYLARSGNISGGGGEVAATTTLEIFTFYCLTSLLLCCEKPNLGLPEYKLKLVNICKMSGTGGLEVVVLRIF